MISTEKKFKDKVTYEPGDLEFYQKMWRIDPDAAKSWIVNRLNTLIEIQEYIKTEIKQLRDMSNYPEDKKALDYYNSTGGEKRTYSRTGNNKTIVLDYMRENLNKNVRMKEIINKFLSLGSASVNVYNVMNDMVKDGSIKRVGYGTYSLSETDN
jgi:hypothetical protein